MSQLDDTILDALTHVTFPKGFAQAEPAWLSRLTVLITHSGKQMPW